MPVEPRPPDIPDFDNNAANSAAPVTATPSGRTIADDGYGTNDALPSSHANQTFNRYSRALRSLDQVPIKPWTGPGTAFLIDEQVLAPDNKFYKALTDHTSTAVFADDLQNGDWILIGGADKAFTTFKPGGTVGIDTDFATLSDALAEATRTRNLFIKEGDTAFISQISAGVAAGTVTITTLDNHTISPGDAVLLLNTDATALMDGPFDVDATPSPNTFEITLPAGVPGMALSNPSTGAKAVIITKEPLKLRSFAAGGSFGEFHIFGENKDTCAIWEDSNYVIPDNGWIPLTGFSRVVFQNLRFMNHRSGFQIMQVFTTIRVNRFEFLDCVFSGTISDQTNNPVPTKGFMTPTNNGLSKAQGWRFYRCVFGEVNDTDGAILISNAKNWIIHGCEFIGSLAVKVINIRNGNTGITISDCVFRPPQDGTSIFIGGAAGPVGADNLAITITGCFLSGTNPGSFGIQIVPFDADDCKSVVITNNFFEGYGHHIDLANPPAGAKQLVIAHNTHGPELSAAGLVRGGSIDERRQTPLDEVVSRMAATSTGTSFPSNAGGLFHLIILDATDTDIIDQAAASAPTAAADMPIPGTENFPFRTRAVLCEVEGNDVAGLIAPIVLAELPNGTLVTLIQVFGGSGVGAHMSVVSTVVVPVFGFISSGQAFIRLYDANGTSTPVRFIGLYID